MNIKRVDIWHLKLAFLSPIKHSLATHNGSENIVVRVTTSRGVAGYGEGVPRAFVTGEHLAESIFFLKEVLAPAAFKLAFDSPQGLMASLEDLYLHLQAVKYPAAFCAMEMALLDAASRSWAKPMTDLIGARVREKAIYSAVLPMAPMEQMARFFEMVKAGSIPFLKLKVGNANDLEVLKMARAKLGWDIDIRVDANSAWHPAEAIERLEEMKPYRISAVEQPVPKEDFEGMKKVAEAVGLPVIADESLCTEADARRLIDLGACQIFNLRLSKCGGLSRSLKIYRMAEEAGVGCQLGCHVGETSILSAAGRHFALSVPRLVYVEGSFSPFLLNKDPVASPVAFTAEGVGEALPGCGLGVEVLDHMLNELAISRKIIS